MTEDRRISLEKAESLQISLKTLENYTNNMSDAQKKKCKLKSNLISILVHQYITLEKKNKELETQMTQLRVRNITFEIFAILEYSQNINTHQQHTSRICY